MKNDNKRIEQLSRIALLNMVRRLPEEPTVPARFPNSFKQAWVDWLSKYIRPGKYGRGDRRRDARFIYNHLNHPEMIIWLAAASGAEAQLVRKAAGTMQEDDSHGTQAATVRRILPWGDVAHHLASSKSHGFISRSRQFEKHFVAYHNSNERGSYYSNAADRRAKRGEEHTCVTAKLNFLLFIYNALMLLAYFSGRGCLLGTLDDVDAEEVESLLLDGG
jgi:hypothetical protein